MNYMQNQQINFILNDSNIPSILNLFQEDFLKCLKKIKSADRAPVFKAFPYAFRIWYYSTQIEGTSLSPANYVNSQLSSEFNSSDMIVPVPTPVISRNSVKWISYNYHTFSINDHPVLSDITNLLSSCNPCIELDEYDNIKESELNRINLNLTHSEEYYYVFLVKICFRLGLLVKIPSINTNQAQVCQNAWLRFGSASRKNQLKKIVDCTIAEASEVLSKVVPMDYFCFSPKNIGDLIKGYFNIDEFFERYFTKLGYNVEDLLHHISSNTSGDKLEEDILEPLSTFFSINSLIDSMLLTPLGYYLQIIQPIYEDRYDFKFRMNELIKGSKSGYVPLQAYFFESCTAFDITPLGKILLLNEGHQVENSQALEQGADYKKLASVILDWHLKCQYNTDLNFLKFIAESVNKVQ